MSRLTLRIDFDGGRALGPGKVRLLELVGETGSISAAGRAMGMSYRRAWLLVDALNQTFSQPVTETRGGGAGGGGAPPPPRWGRGGPGTRWRRALQTLRTRWRRCPEPGGAFGAHLRPTGDRSVG